MNEFILRFGTKILLSLSLISTHLSGQSVRWQAQGDQIMTRWAEQINVDKVHSHYPRPTMMREEWMSMNGLWNFAIVPKQSGKPARYDMEILVPFPVESALSGIGRRVSDKDLVWYKRRFFIPETWSGKHIILNLEASDWETNIFINGTLAATHRGGYDPISLDITALLREKGAQEIEVSVWDPTDQHYQIRGKQKSEPGGIWYTPVSGIWQSIWLEPVGQASLSRLHLDADIDKNILSVGAQTRNTNVGDSLLVVLRMQAQEVGRSTAPVLEKVLLNVPNPRLWSPERPFLYDIDVYLVRQGYIIDKVTGYAGMRKIHVDKDERGKDRIFLNNQAYFQLGLLDQGWWPDGLYTPAAEDAFIHDIRMAKRLGYNLLRKHVKVEPEVWYYHCDRLGMLVWQDIPNGDAHAPWEPPSGLDGVEINRSFASAEQFKIEMEAIVKARRNHPSIVMWIPFNEGWGQFNTVEITQMLQELDPGRLVGGPSGGNYFPVGHTRDHHQYPGPGMPPADPGRALVLSEFGGLGWAVKGHLWKGEGWGYKTLESRKAYENAYISLFDNMESLISEGLSAAVYTQISDVETEINGILTYDRKVLKYRPRKIVSLHQKFAGPIK
ncbi:MAG: beta-galactosidase [Cyclobacteriaceae bacterium]|nr:beta-galactosidase [Cyclobacteriaceae bacterium]